MFSIVAAVYNSELYLLEMIDSVKKQTFHAWELILVDDGSTDGSGALCDRAAEKDTRIKVIHSTNQGGLRARYAGVRESRGEYVIVIDSDDRMAAGCLENVYHTVRIVDADMVIWAFRTFGLENREVSFSLKPGHLYPQKEIVYTSLMDTSHSLWIRAIRGDIIRKSCTCRLGKLSINTDYAMLIPILCNIRNAYVTDEVLYEYRIYQASVSHSLSIDKIIDTDRVSDYALAELRKLAWYNGNIEKAVYVSYLKMVWGRIFSLFLYGMLNRKQCKMIHLLPVYTCSEKYETVEFFRVRELVLMKAFRKSLYAPFHLLRFARFCKKRLVHGITNCL